MSAPSTSHSKGGPSVTRVSHRNLWPWLICLWFVLFFAVDLGLIVMAVRSRSDLVSPDYYLQEIGYQQRIDATRRVASLKTAPQVHYDAAVHEVRLHVPEEARVGGLVGTVTLYRPDDARSDRKYLLHLDADGNQVLATSQWAGGRWKVRMAWSTERGSFYHEATIVVRRPS